MGRSARGPAARRRADVPGQPRRGARGAYARGVSVRNLERIFAPSSVALVGATDRPGSVGRAVLENLKGSGFAGPVIPVNPHHAELLGLETFPSLTSLPLTPDLVVVCTPGQAIPAIIDEGGGLGVRGVVTLSAGFGETCRASGSTRPLPPGCPPPATWLSCRSPVPCAPQCSTGRCRRASASRTVSVGNMLDIRRRGPGPTRRCRASRCSGWSARRIRRNCQTAPEPRTAHLADGAHNDQAIGLAEWLFQSRERLGRLRVENKPGY